MNARHFSLVLVASLLAWSSGLLLNVHVHHVDEDHHSDDCDVCLVLHAGCCKAVVNDAAPSVSGQQVSRSAPPEPASVVLVSQAHSAMAPRAPPVS